MFALNSTTREAKALLRDLAVLQLKFDNLRVHGIAAAPRICRRCCLTRYAVRGLAAAAVAAEYLFLARQLGLLGR
jgi:hypothetical protein